MYLAFFHLIILKNQVRLNPDQITGELLEKIRDLPLPACSEKEDEEWFIYLQDEHHGDLEMKLVEMSKLFPEYKFLIREFPIDHDYVTYDYFIKGKHFSFFIDIPIPQLSERNSF